MCINELGSTELDRRGAELLFQVLTEREEMNSMAIASNESFSGCSNVIETGTNSYRLATTRVPRPAPRADEHEAAEG